MYLDEGKGGVGGGGAEEDVRWRPRCGGKK